MGKIKSRTVRRTADTLLQRGIEFNESFEDNKKILGSNMPSKKLRNQLAGFLARLKKQERLARPKILDE
jgi:ribosomal protein S17E